MNCLVRSLLTWFIMIFVEMAMETFEEMIKNLLDLSIEEKDEDDEDVECSNAVGSSRIDGLVL